MAPQSKVPPAFAGHPIRLSPDVEKQEITEGIGEQALKQLQREREEYLACRHRAR